MKKMRNLTKVMFASKMVFEGDLYRSRKASNANGAVLELEIVLQLSRNFYELEIGERKTMIIVNKW